MILVCRYETILPCYCIELAYFELPVLDGHGSNTGRSHSIYHSIYLYIARCIYIPQWEFELQPWWPTAHHSLAAAAQSKAFLHLIFLPSTCHPANINTVGNGPHKASRGPNLEKKRQSIHKRKQNQEGYKYVSNVIMLMERQTLMKTTPYGSTENISSRILYFGDLL